MAEAFIEKGKISPALIFQAVRIAAAGAKSGDGSPSPSIDEGLIGPIAFGVLDFLETGDLGAIKRYPM